MAPLAPATCVEAVKRVLGIHAWPIITPRQLYDYLLKDETKNLDIGRRPSIVRLSLGTGVSGYAGPAALKSSRFIIPNRPLEGERRDVRCAEAGRVPERARVVMALPQTRSEDRSGALWPCPPAPGRRGSRTGRNATTSRCHSAAAVVQPGTPWREEDRTALRRDRTRCSRPACGQLDGAADAAVVDVVRLRRGPGYGRRDAQRPGAGSRAHEPDRPGSLRPVEFRRRVAPVLPRPGDRRHRLPDVRRGRDGRGFGIPLYRGPDFSGRSGGGAHPVASTRPIAAAS